MYTDLPLPPDPPHRRATAAPARACLDACPTGAIVAPYRVDARRCISYLTIELAAPFPKELRPLARQPHLRLRRLPAVLPMEPLRPSLAKPISRPATGWTAPLGRAVRVDGRAIRRTRWPASPIRRIGHERWLRNIAVALGNGPGFSIELAIMQADELVEVVKHCITEFGLHVSGLRLREKTGSSGGSCVTLHVMLEDALEQRGMLGVSGFLGMGDVIDDHALDALLAARRMHEIVTQFDSHHFRDVFMLGDGENFFFGQLGQFDTVLQRQHDDAPYSVNGLRPPLGRGHQEFALTCDKLVSNRARNFSGTHRPRRVGAPFAPRTGVEA
jgi:hypothetical protein